MTFQDLYLMLESWLPGSVSNFLAMVVGQVFLALVGRELSAPQRPKIKSTCHNPVNAMHCQAVMPQYTEPDTSEVDLARESAATKTWNADPAWKTLAKPERHNSFIAYRQAWISHGLLQ